MTEEDTEMQPTIPAMPNSEPHLRSQLDVLNELGGERLGFETPDELITADTPEDKQS